MEKDLTRFYRESIAEKRVLSEAISWAERAEGVGASADLTRLKLAAIALLSALRETEVG